MQIPDWEAAEARLRELLAQDPNHAGAQSLASEFADRKREEFVSLCITQARRLQAEGDIGRALAMVTHGLEAYPNDSRFEKLRATLQRAHAEAPWQPATHDTGETAVRPPPAGPGVAPSPQAPAEKSALRRLRGPPAPSSAFSATAILGAVPAQPIRRTPTSAHRHRLPPPRNVPARSHPLLCRQKRSLQSPRRPFRALQTAQTRKAAEAAAAAGPQFVAGLCHYAAAGPRRRGVVIVSGVLIAPSRHRAPKPIVAATFKVMLRSSPDGAAISVGRKPCGSSTCESSCRLAATRRTLR